MCIYYFVISNRHENNGARILNADILIIMTLTKTIRVNDHVLSVTIANHFFSRLRGLLFKPALKLNEAILITPCSSVHTLGMRYAIDIVFLGADNQILKLVNNCLPTRIASCKHAKHCLELLAGESARLGFKAGMQLPTML